MINVIDIIKTISRLIYASIVFREPKNNSAFSLVYKYKFGSCFTPPEYYEECHSLKEILGATFL